MRGRDVVPLHEFLGKTFAGFKLCGRFGRTERTPSTSGKLIDHTKRQRQFRSDDGEIGLDSIRNRNKRIQAFHINRQTSGISSDPAIARRANNLVYARRLTQFPHKRVLSAATSYDQNFHDGQIRLGAGEGDVKLREGWRFLECQISDFRFFIVYRGGQEQEEPHATAKCPKEFEIVTQG
jgi:hypothetical protein